MRIATPFCGITWVWYNELQCKQWEQNMRKIILRNYLYDNALQKTTFLCCKSMVFGVQKPYFYIAKTPFLHCKKGELH